MTDTAFKIGDAQRRRLAKIHARTPDGMVSTDIEVPQNPEFHMGGGGLYSTVGDYLKFTQMILHGGKFNGAKCCGRKPSRRCRATRWAIWFATR